MTREHWVQGLDWCWVERKIVNWYTRLMFGEEEGLTDVRVWNEDWAEVKLIDIGCITVSCIVVSLY